LVGRPQFGQGAYEMVATSERHHAQNMVRL